jgi:putative transposase
MPWTDSARRQYARTATRYTTDLTDAEFALIVPHLPPPSRLGRPRTVDLREVLNAILYLLRSGCPWDLLPKELPAKSTVFGYFRRWWEDGTWPMLHAKLVMAAREQAGKEASPTAGIVDSQSVRTTEAGGPRGGACPPASQGLERGDAGKKINGRKRHILVDTLGLLLVVVIHTANIQDRDGLALVCRRLRRRFPWLRLIGACPRAGLLAGPGGRWRLPRRDRRLRCSTGASAAPDRQARARHPWLRRPAQTLAGREDVRLVRPQSAAGQRLRGNPRVRRKHGPPRLDPAPHPTPRKSLRSIAAFSDGHLLPV